MVSTSAKPKGARPPYGEFSPAAVRCSCSDRRPTISVAGSLVRTAADQPGAVRRGLQFAEAVSLVAPWLRRRSEGNHLTARPRNFPEVQDLQAIPSGEAGNGDLVTRLQLLAVPPVSDEVVRSQIEGPSRKSGPLEEIFHATILPGSCNCSRDRDVVVHRSGPACPNYRSL